MAKCTHSMLVDDRYICNLYGNYCFLDEPDSSLCVEMYGEVDENQNITSYSDDPDDGRPDEIDDIIDEVGIEDLEDIDDGD